MNRGGAPSVRSAVLLGVLQGPCELLPISSSAHLTLVPWLLGHAGEAQDPELRKALEVALHAGTAAALLVSMRGKVADALGQLSARSASVIMLATLPPAIAGLTFERWIERHLGTPRTIAWGLLAGSAGMLLTDGLPQRRSHRQAGAADGLWLGLAQAAALIPGISRNGATLVCARARGFAREDAEVLSRQAALPVIAGATGLKSLRLVRRTRDTRTLVALGAGALSSAASTLAAASWLGDSHRNRRLRAFALYRAVLAAGTLRRLAKDERTFRSARASTMRS